MGELGNIDGDSLLENTRLKIQVVGKMNYFIDYRNALVDSLLLKGIEAKAFDEISMEWNPDVVIVIGPQCYEKTLRRLKDKTVLSCALFTEQMFSREIGYKNRGMTMTWNTFRESKYFDLVFDWSISNCKIISKWHPRVIYFPHSYYKGLEITNDIRTKKKYDLCFIGAITGEHDRRFKILNKLKEKYSVCPNTEGIWGKEKGEVMASSKIGLNLHQDQGLVMESPRLYDYFANHCFVLSEPIKYSQPFEIGVDFDTFIMTDMCRKIDYYLSNEYVRERMISSAYDKVKGIPLEKSINIMLDAIMMEFYYYKYKGNMFTKASNLIKKFR